MTRSRTSLRNALARRHRLTLTGYAFVLPAFVLLGYFVYYPAYVAFAGSFTNWDGFNPAQWVGLDNFRQLFGDPTFSTAAWNNLLWALGKVALALVPPFVVAELIFHVRASRWQFVYRSLFVIPLVIPTIVTMLVWTFYYRSDGVINQVLGAVGLDALQHSWLGDSDTALYALILMGFPWIAPFNLLVFYSGLQRTPKEILEAAALDGCGTWRRIRSIDLPMMMRQTRLLTTLAVINSVQAILEPLLMTGGGPGNSTMTPIYYLYRTGVNDGRFGYSMAVSLVLFAVVLVLSAVSNRVLRPQSD
ncbi:carbohydrate ABC transporter permease [Streptomyces sp. WAC 04229]|uniref:carbohydrate ABC transporter permease n=1 Tax=Streptomyces sp. WAC 04229 TaxID=2203206 RepID=UPI003D74868F